MRVNYLKLVNYADIMAGTGKRSFVCDLSESRKRIVLLLGPNGSGKTAIISKLHPYAYTIGDSREGKSIILEGQTGYKEIRYQNGPDEYIIKHFINEKGTVKSYFIENGVELNPNGNVTSFKEIVETVLGVTEDTLKLMRLGANSSTFIKMSSIQRKAFTSELLSDIDILGSLYKQINANFRVLRGLMKNVTSKIESLNLGDLESAKLRIKEWIELIEMVNSNRDTLLQNLGSIRSELGTLDDVTMFKMENELKSLRDEMNLLDVQLESVEGKSLKATTAKLESFRAMKEASDKDVTRYETLITSSKNKVNDLMNDIDALTAKLLMIQSTAEVGELTQLLEKLDTEIKTAEKKFKEFNTTATLDDFKRLLDIYRDIDSKVMISHSFDHEMIKSIIDLELSGKNVDLHLNEEYKRKYNDVEQLKAQILANRNKGSVQGKQYMIFKDSKCACACPFEEFFDEIMNSNKKDEKDIEKDLRLAENALDLMDDKFAVSANINLIKMTLSANKSTIDKLPTGIITLEGILNAMYTSSPIYDEEYITRFITVMEDYSHIDILKEKRLEVKEELSKLNTNSDTITFLKEDLAKKRTQVQSERETISEYEGKLDELIADRTAIESALSEVEEEVSVLHSLSDKIREREDKVKRVREIESSFSKRNELVKSKAEVSSELSKVEAKLAHANDTKEELVRRVNALETLEKELKQLEAKYEKTVIIRKALSSNEGIPLVYIKLYMMDINTYINKLLKSVYGDGLEIREFIIDEKGFQIPYVSNGVLVPDVSMVSQGEESFMNLAFSSAFKRRVSGIYNVFGFDELDGPLDAGRREKFVETLETELDELGAEQAFIISHNNVFESYDVDAILTGPANLSNYSSLNVVHQV